MGACPGCGAAHKAGAHFCTRCGRSLDDAGPTSDASISPSAQSETTTPVAPIRDLYEDATHRTLAPHLDLQPSAPVVACATTNVPAPPGKLAGFLPPNLKLLATDRRLLLVAIDKKGAKYVEEHAFSAITELRVEKGFLARKLTFIEDSRPISIVFTVAVSAEGLEALVSHIASHGGNIAAAPGVEGTEGATGRFDGAFIGASVKPEHVHQALSKYIDKGEKLIGVYHGTPLRGAGGEIMGGFALNHYMLLTERRVLFWGRGLTSDSTDAFFYDDIASAEGSQGLLLGEVTLNVRGAKERFTNMTKAEVPIATRMIRERMSQARASKGAAQGSAGESIPSQIKKLAELRDAGIVTPEEFEKKKRELLDRM